MSQRRWTILWALVWCFPNLCFGRVGDSTIALVSDSEARCLIVLSDQPSPSARHGATELAQTLGQMSGANVPVVSEAQLRAEPLDANAAMIFIGDCEEAKASNLEG